MGFFYINFVKKNIYKVGHSENFINILSECNENPVLSMYVSNHIEFKILIINLFTKKLGIKELGDNYFEGDLSKMIQIVLNEYNKNKIQNNINMDIRSKTILEVSEVSINKSIIDNIKLIAVSLYYWKCELNHKEFSDISDDVNCFNIYLIECIKALNNGEKIQHPKLSDKLMNKIFNSTNERLIQIKIKYRINTELINYIINT